MSWEISVFKDYVKIGENPDGGLVLGWVNRIQAKKADGSRMILADHQFSDEDEAERFAMTLNSDAPDHGRDWFSVPPILEEVILPMVKSFNGEEAEHYDAMAERWENERQIIG